MAKQVRSRSAGEEPPDPADYDAFVAWLRNRPRQTSVLIACRAALRVLPLLPTYPGGLLSTYHGGNEIFLPVFRAAAIARLAAKYPNRAIEYAAAANAAARAANAAATRAANAAATVSAAAYAADTAVDARASYADAAAIATDHAFDAVTATDVATATVAIDILRHEIRKDASPNLRKRMGASQLLSAPLWSGLPPPRIGGAWQGLSQQLHMNGSHWSVWIDWYEDVLHGTADEREEYAAAFTDIPGKLPWDEGAEAVNIVIARRLRSLPPPLTSIPDQSPAPVQVEERDGRIAQRSDRDSGLNATERDFNDWRDPILDHIGELTASEFSAGTNHARVRDRLTALQTLLPGAIDEVKDRQFRIGYEIERFEGLLAAYRASGDDMPMLNAAQLEDLGRLHVALRMGTDKLERWVEFKRKAGESEANEGAADREVVAEALEDMAAQMAQRPQYFAPELPASFRFLVEALRDPAGATKTVIFGSVKSVQNLLSFLGQKAVGIGKNAIEGVETHISKAVAAALIGSFGTAALAVSNSLPQGWTWLKLLLEKISAGG